MSDYLTILVPHHYQRRKDTQMPAALVAAELPGADVGAGDTNTH